MPTTRTLIQLSKIEIRFIKMLAKDAGLSFSNYVRHQLGLEPLKRGVRPAPAGRKAKEQPTTEEK